MVNILLRPNGRHFCLPPGREGIYAGNSLVAGCGRLVICPGRYGIPITRAVVLLHLSAYRLFEAQA